MLRYQETIEQSAEYLRLAIPLMSRQPVAFHPISYCVWYEYVAGINRPLKVAIDEMVKAGKTLDEKTTEALFGTYIAGRDQNVAQRVTSGFSKVMSDISRDAANVGEHAHRFGNTLEQWTEEQERPVPEAPVNHGVARLLSGTREMQGAIATLQERLDESRKEIEMLQQEVGRVREEALADGLTGLVNRRGFELALAACLGAEDPSAQGPCLLFADLDHFKRINDTYGHLVGDKVLRAVAQVLRANVKGKDTAARFGGEEFVVLLPDTSVAGAVAVAEKIRTTVEGSRIRHTDTRQEIAQITISFGIAAYCAGETPKEFLSRGDAALYTSKSLGRNRVTVAPARQALS